MAYNFAVKGVLSLDVSQNASKHGLTPTNYREPLPPIVLGLHLRALQVFHGPLSFEFLMTGPGARLAKLSNLFWGVLLCVAVFAALKILTGSNVLALVGSLIVGVNADVDSLYTDLPAVALLAGLSLFALIGVRTRRLADFSLAGISLGALILTKGAFLYVAFALLACLAIWSMSQWRNGCRDVAFGSILFFLCVGVVIGPWMARNYYFFGAPVITERGGVVLMYRALKNQMNRTEYLGTFYVWAPSGWTKEFAGKVLGFNKEDLRKGGRLQHLNRSGRADFAAEDYVAEQAGLPEAAISYYRRARAERVRIERELKELGQPHPESAGDVELQRRAMALIRAHPLKHIAMTLPFLWRGAPVIAPLLAVFFIAGMLRRRYDLIAYMLPAIGMVAFLALATHNIPRYNAPAWPIVIVLCVVTLHSMTLRLRQRFQRKNKQRKTKPVHRRRKPKSVPQPALAPFVAGPTALQFAETWNLEVYRDASVVSDFLNRSSLYPAEEVVFDKYRPVIAAARVLDVGVGAGRTTFHLVSHCRLYRGIDYSPPMIDACRRRFPDYAPEMFVVGDARDLSSEPAEGFDFVLFSYNGLDYIGHKDRLQALAEIRRVLVPGGLFFFSTHSLHAFPFSDPEVQSRNQHVDLDILERQGWYQLIDKAKDVVTYYIYPDVQRRQLRDAGFEFIEAFDMKGGSFDFGSPPKDWMVHFLCRAVAASRCKSEKEAPQEARAMIVHHAMPPIR